MNKIFKRALWMTPLLVALPYTIKVVAKESLPTSLDKGSYACKYDHIDELNLENYVVKNE